MSFIQDDGAGQATAQSPSQSPGLQALGDCSIGPQHGDSKSSYAAEEEVVFQDNDGDEEYMINAWASIFSQSLETREAAHPSQRGIIDTACASATSLSSPPITAVSTQQIRVETSSKNGQSPTQPLLHSKREAILVRNFVDKIAPWVRFWIIIYCLVH